MTRGHFAELSQHNPWSEGIRHRGGLRRQRVEVTATRREPIVLEPEGGARGFRPRVVPEVSPRVVPEVSGRGFQQRGARASAIEGA
jgi:hypothetical protein